MIYKGQDNSSAIKHWKYLRRERVGDKWRYYYAEDDNKLKVDRAHKKTLTVGGRTNHYITRPENNHKWEEVDKETWDKTSTMPKLYVGKMRLSAVSKQQIGVGKKFVKDLFSGKVTFKKKKK